MATRSLRFKDPDYTVETDLEGVGAVRGGSEALGKATAPPRRASDVIELASLGVEKDATIEVKMRGRGGMNTADGKQVGEPSSPSKVHVEQKLRDAQGAGVKEVKAGKEALPAPRKASDVIELHGGLTLKLPQASIAYPPYTPCPQKLL